MDEKRILENPFNPTVFRSIDTKVQGWSDFSLPSPAKSKLDKPVKQWDFLPALPCFPPSQLTQWQKNGLTYTQWMKLVQEGIQYPPLVRQIGLCKLGLVT
jgi:hypothetical protein